MRYFGPGLLQSGDIIAFSRRCRWYDPRTWLAWRIKADTGSRWNHVGIVHREMPDGPIEIVEALWAGGVVARPLEGVLARYSGDVAAYRIDGEHKHARAAARWARAMVGRPYARVKILRIRALQLLLGGAAVDSIIAPSLKASDAFICSGLVIRAYRQAGWPLSDVGDFAGPGAVTRSPTLRRVG